MVTGLVVGLDGVVVLSCVVDEVDSDSGVDWLVGFVDSSGVLYSEDPGESDVDGDDDCF